MTAASLVKFHHIYICQTYRKKNFFVTITLMIDTFNNFHVKHSAVLTIFIVLNITSLTYVSYTWKLLW